MPPAYVTMRTIPTTASFLCFLTCAVLAPGCVVPTPRGELAYGEWSGEGSFVYERWAKTKAGSLQPSMESSARTYPTTLTIRPGRLDGREVIELEVHSDRGPIADLDDKTHLKVALVRAKRVSESTVLYRPVSFQFNPGPDEQPKCEADSPAYGASCTTHNDVTTFQIEYMDNFVETFRFHGRHLEKTGVFFNRDEGLVHWFERLSQAP